jgi:hypothetical protein
MALFATITMIWEGKLRIWEAILRACEGYVEGKSLIR